MYNILLGLGSNEGDRLNFINKALHEIKNQIGMIINQSDIYETQSWNYSDRDYLNCVAEVQTNLDINSLMTACEAIEKRLGRTIKTKDQYSKKPKYSSRIIDIDILFYDDVILQTEQLVIPHPHLHKRKFVLIPLTQTNPNFIHPILKKTAEELLYECKDTCKVERYTEKK